MDVMAMQQELKELTDSPEKIKEIEKGEGVALRSFEIAAEMCASITKSQYPEMDKDWLLKNTDVVQIKELLDLVTKAVFHSLEQSEDPEIKKPAAAETSP